MQASKKNFKSIPTESNNSFYNVPSSENDFLANGQIHSNSEMNKNEGIQQDGVWLVPSDQIQNYKVYFPKYNLDNLLKKRQ